MSEGVHTYQAACQQIRDLESLLAGYGYREPYAPEPPLDPLELAVPEERREPEAARHGLLESASPMGPFPGSSPVSSFAGTPPLMGSWLPVGSGEPGRAPTARGWQCLERERGPPPGPGDGSRSEHAPCSTFHPCPPHHSHAGLGQGSTVPPGPQLTTMRMARARQDTPSSLASAEDFSPSMRCGV